MSDASSALSIIDWRHGDDGDINQGLVCLRLL